jgi:hypothetical protein
VDRPPPTPLVGKDPEVFNGDGLIRIRVGPSPYVGMATYRSCVAILFRFMLQRIILSNNSLGLRRAAVDPFSVTYI